MLNHPPEYPEALVIVAEAVYQRLREANVDHQIAAEAAFSAAEALRLTLGGIRVYIPKGATYASDTRADEIYARFNGRNASQLARIYHLSEERIRQICTERTLAERAARQGNLAL